MDRKYAGDPQEITERKRLLGKRIQQRRAELDLTQEDVAQLGGISSETVRQYEVGRGGDRPTARILESLDQALGWCLGSSKTVLMTGVEPVVDGEAAPPTPLPVELHTSQVQLSSRVSVERVQLRKLAVLATDLLASAANADDPKELLGDITALNRLATEMTLSAT